MALRAGIACGSGGGVQQGRARPRARTTDCAQMGPFVEKVNEYRLVSAVGLACLLQRSDDGCDSTYDGLCRRDGSKKDDCLPVTVSDGGDLSWVNVHFEARIGCGDEFHELGHVWLPPNRSPARTYERVWLRWLDPIQNAPSGPTAE